MAARIVKLTKFSSRRPAGARASNGRVQAEEQLEQAQQDLQDAEDAINEHTYAIVKCGIIIRSVERGLVDFPGMRDGRIVYLCRLAGENEIKHWHQPIDLLRQTIMAVSEKKILIGMSNERHITAIRTLKDDTPRARLFVYAPGAGSNISDSFGVYLCRRLAEEGIGSVRFQFEYMEAKRRRPDSPPVLEETWRKVIDVVRRPDLKIAVGGRSMGGRIASQVVAKGAEVDSLVLFAYPLRPPWNPSQVRDKHLSQIATRTLFCSGTRDTFATPDELSEAASKVPGSTVFFLDGADHGFDTLKSSGRPKEDVWEEAMSVTLEWLEMSPN